jgi:Nucleoside-diphosphate-sugar epimerases
MKALVLGGGGFLGSHLVDELLNRDHDVRVLDRATEQYRTTPNEVDYRLGDFADPAVVAEALQDIDTVYHLASATVPSTSNLDPAADITANLVPGVRLLEQLVRLDVRRIVFLSSGGTVYGNPKQVPVAVEHPVSPLCSYGVVKLATEHYLHMFQELYGLSPTILRASNPYGPRQGHLGVQGAIATFLDRLFKGEPIRIWGDGRVVRDYLYVTDLARLCVLAGESANEGTYNAGSGIGYSLNAVLEAVEEVTGKHAEVRFGASRSLDVDRIVLDISVTESVFGWRPDVDLRDGIALHWAWVRQSR